MIRAKDIRKYWVNKKTGESEFRIEKEFRSTITAQYAVSTGALKYWILDHLNVQLHDGVFKEMVYRNVAKVFSGEESDWYISRVDIFPDMVVVEFRNDFFQYISCSDEITDAHLEQLGINIQDSRLDDDSPEFDPELLEKVVTESEDEYRQRIGECYPELLQCIDDVTDKVYLKFTGPTYIHLTEKNVRFNYATSQRTDIKYKIELTHDKKCIVEELQYVSSTQAPTSNYVCNICRALFYWYDPPLYKIMTGEVSYNHAAMLL